MVVFFGFLMIGVVVGKIWTRNERGGYWTKDRVMILCVMAGILLGAGASFWGGSFVKKEIVVKKYFIQPMIFDGKPVVALKEEHDSNYLYDNSYIFQIKEEDKTKLIKHGLSKGKIFFDLGEDEERYLKVKRSKACGRNMWVWFFYVETLIKSEAVFKKGDSFLTLPKDYSL